MAKRPPLLSTPAPPPPPEPPATGGELRPGGALQRHHHRTREAHRQRQGVHRLKEEDSPLCPPFRMVRYPMSAMLFPGKFGDVRRAMSEMLHADFEEVHKPFVDPTRPDGYTHLVDDETDRSASDKPVDESRKKIEWKTNIYGF